MLKRAVTCASLAKLAVSSVPMGAVRRELVACSSHVSDSRNLLGHIRQNPGSSKVGLVGYTSRSRIVGRGRAKRMLGCCSSFSVSRGTRSLSAIAEKDYCFVDLLRLSDVRRRSGRSECGENLVIYWVASISALWYLFLAYL
ncbi:hypothetical protein DFJ73DRAFT_805410, partial [Zopfochytrium polystomum]